MEKCQIVYENSNGPAPPTGSSTLTLKGLLAKYDRVDDNQPAIVYAGKPGEKKERVLKTDMKDVEGDVFVDYTIPNGYEVEIWPVTSGTTTEAADVVGDNDKIYLINDVPVFLNETPVARDTITLTMSKNLTIEIKAEKDAPTDGILAQEVTIGKGVKGNWSKTAPNAVTEKALVEGKNYVYDGATITFTDNGAGTKVIEDTAGFVASNAGSGIYDAKEKDSHSKTTAPIGNGASNAPTPKTFNSAVKVTMVGTGAEGKIGATTATSAAGTAGYVAIGRTLLLGDNTFDGFILNAKVGAPIKNNSWKVEAVGEDRDVTIYGGVKVYLGEGVSATWNENNANAPTGTALKSGDCVIKGGYINKVSTSIGTDVVSFKVDFMDDAVMTDEVFNKATAVSAAIDLESATKVTLFDGEDSQGTAVHATAVAWGKTAACEEVVFYDKDGAVASATPAYQSAAGAPANIFVKTNSKIYLKVDGSNLDNRDSNGHTVVTNHDVMKLGVYVGGKQDTSIVPQDYYVTFQVTGAKPISVRQVVTTDAAGDLAETIHTAVSGNAKGVITFEGSTIHAYGNLQYLGGDAEFNKAHSAWTVTGDLGRFLRQAHTTTSANVVYYNDVAYTWNATVVGSGQYARYDEEAGEYVTILADLVDAAGYGEDADGKYFDVSFNGVTIRFMVHLDTTLKTNSSTGKQE